MECQTYPILDPSDQWIGCREPETCNYFNAGSSLELHMICQDTRSEPQQADSIVFTSLEEQCYSTHVIHTHLSSWILRQAKDSSKSSKLLG
jgi:hypothetical protein